ncbi:peptide chain release factor 2 [Enterobacteriaceae endosymbiont of Plateumaris braccata]|uniref:peptide chain release factor 2 n=1 Tax=Enterobacteriaceae endosymbiont of Plateumaris braccata TaxID=2675793 RepID=UPI001B3AC3D8|nr:peptide chain release factor 2 [Enterobacteriaceae endosymbiont of Plateumaris braccata]
MFETNLIKNNLQKIKKRNNFIRNFLDYLKLKKKLFIINNQFKNSNIWKNINFGKNLSKEKFYIENIISTLDIINQEIADIDELITLAIDTNDNTILHESIQILYNIKNKLDKLEFQKFFIKKNDNKNCFIDIKAGSGGIESQDWAQMIMRMYLKWAEKKNFKTCIIKQSSGEKIGIKSATIKIMGNYAFGWLRTENGIHRLVRKSPFNTYGRRHTSFSSTFIYPETNKHSNIIIKPDDLRIDVYRSSGAGGQHVNRTESAVRITHIPTGIVTQCQNNRSQHKNKYQAIKQIKKKLYELDFKNKTIAKQKIENSKLNISWSYQIRSYILDDARIKDVRTGVETNNIQSVLNGNIDIFIKASLKIGL